MKWLLCKHSKQQIKYTQPKILKPCSCHLVSDDKKEQVVSVTFTQKALWHVVSQQQG